MKHFIAISLMWLSALPAIACGWADNHNDYLYRIYNRNEFRERTEKICNDNWQAYLGTSEEYYWFNADQVLKAARKKGDALMVSYVQNLQRYLKCASVEQRRQNEWAYPSKAEVTQMGNDLAAVRTYALGKTKSRLRSQHALLYMRCNMMMGRHQENIAYWEQTASQLIETVYKDMMKNIYAGALYRTGQEDRAGALFAEMGDYESLMTLYYKKRSYKAIKQEYERDPNSAVLPFLLQDFVNNTQEAVDAINDELAFGGKLFIRDISRQEASLMRDFCAKVVSEHKSQVPLMWQCAKAWIEYLWGNGHEAARDIMTATGLQGTERMKDCFRELKLYITASQAKPSPSFDDYLADELEWLWNRRQDGYALRVIDRLAHQVLYRQYASQPSRIAALMNIDDTSKDYLDTLGVDQTEAYLTYANNPATNKLDRFLKALPRQMSRQQVEELIGTKYMRLCRWQEAIKWLQPIPAAFYQEAGYAVYAANRKYDVEPWMKRQWLSEAVTYSDSKWRISTNPKLAFAKEMLKSEAQLKMLTGKAKEQACYNLAVHYAQANFRGDCWWLMRDYKSVGDTVRAGEADLSAKTIALLRQAAASADQELRLKALFALSYRELYADNHWREEEWTDDGAIWSYRQASPQYHALKSLFAATSARQAEPAYVSRCDEFAQFCKYYRQHHQ